MQASDPTFETGGERPQKTDSKFDPLQTTGGKCQKKAEVDGCALSLHPPICRPR
jgi:hypothetical protein